MNPLQRILQSKWLERSKRQLGKLTGLHIKLKRFTASASEPLRTAMLLKNAEVDLVIDIGANTGQFAESLYDFGYAGQVLSFEPVPEAHQEISKRSLPYPKWTIAERMAIGETDGEIEFHITDEMSEKIFIIPPKRTRYLSEIAENNRHYDEWAAGQAEVADKLYAIQRTMESISEEDIKKVSRIQKE